MRYPKLISSEKGDGTLLSDWLERIDRGEPIRCAEDQSFSIIDVVDAVEAMVALIEADATGVYHVGGPTAWRRSEFLATFVAELRRYRDVDPDIRLCSIRDFEDFAERRPFDTSLNSDKLARDVGFRARDVAETCRTMAEALYSEGD